MTLGLAQLNCFAGQQLVVDPDGTETCVTTFNAQTLGNPAPNCSYGSAYIDPSTNDWACPAPPAPQQSSGLGMFLVAAIIAFVAWQMLVPKVAKSSERVSKGDFSDFLPSWAKG